ncbi:hypothetical protein Pfo_021832 [Paulownia fortunei]|nr:hypothetical protein Pfo_021832 [Paulownia fortunei]
MPSNRPSLFHNIFNHPTSIKLDRNNFLLQKSQVLLAIRGHQLVSFIFGTQEIPPKFISHTVEGRMELIPNPDFITWEQQDQLLLSLLLLLMSEGILGYVVGCQTSHKVWSTIESMLAVETAENIFDLQIELQNTKEGSITYILNGLGLEFIPLVTSIITIPTPVSLSKLATMVIRFECHLEKQQYQVYGKLGHVTLNCYHKFGSNFQAHINKNSNQMSTMVENPHTVADSSWYAEFGATHHLNSDLQNLSLHTLYHGSKNFFVENGIDNNCFFEFHPTYFFVKD